MSQRASSGRVLVADALSDGGVQRLRDAGLDVTVRTGMKAAELAAALGEHDALIVRSATQVTAEALAAPGRLRAIGRAGTGVDNIDLEAATRAGIVVMNTPGGNSVAAAELTLALLLALARHVPQADRDLRGGRWERKKYVGVELEGKLLGVVGLGRIGREVARRALAFRMKLLGHDPFVASGVALDSGIERVGLEELAARSDFVTLHLPLSPETRHLFGPALIARMKPGARLINCARGGLVDETALHTALESGRVAGAALDVFENEPPLDSPLVGHPAVICTPHLGASTQEAQERVGTEIADKIAGYLASGAMLDAVNFPPVAPEEYTTLRPLMDLAERLGSFLSQISPGGIRALDVRALGAFGEHALRPLAMAAARGLLERIVEGNISYVNALQLASARGIRVEEIRSSEPSAYSGLLRLAVGTDQGTTTVAGTLIGDGQPRLVEIDGMAIEARPGGQMLFLRNRDVPGVVGKVGAILGRAGVNIAGIHLGRSEPGAVAVSIINVDGAVPAGALEELRRIDEVLLAGAVRIRA